jgi:FMN phosphatase YigB (HAD superfamily)
MELNKSFCGGPGGGFYKKSPLANRSPKAPMRKREYKMKMLITDLDNTLYDWVTFFSRAFKAMVDELSSLINVQEDRLLDEFKTLHRHYGNTEQPFVILELPSVKKHFGDLPGIELMEKLNPALHAFNSSRKRNLRLFPGVKDILEILNKDGIIIIGFTEAIAINGYYRLFRLDILDSFKRLYALEGNYKGHPNPEAEKRLAPPENFLRVIPNSRKKPDPQLLLDICKEEGVPPGNTWYLGDSLFKDISMAKQAGIKSIWAKYGAEYDEKLWAIIVKVTHWTEKDVRSEKRLRKKFPQIKPDYTIDSFEEIYEIIKHKT